MSHQHQGGGRVQGNITKGDKGVGVGLKLAKKVSRII
jgi:hypothetical protein